MTAPDVVGIVLTSHTLWLLAGLSVCGAAAECMTLKFRPAVKSIEARQTECCEAVRQPAVASRE